MRLLLNYDDISDSGSAGDVILNVDNIGDSGIAGYVGTVKQIDYYGVLKGATNFSLEP